MTALAAEVERNNSERLQLAVADALEPLLAPLKHAVSNLHVDMLRQLHIQKVCTRASHHTNTDPNGSVLYLTASRVLLLAQTEFAQQLAAHEAKLAAAYMELETLRKENAELRRLY